MSVMRVSLSIRSSTSSSLSSLSSLLLLNKSSQRTQRIRMISSSIHNNNNNNCNYNNNGNVSLNRRIFADMSMFDLVMQAMFYKCCQYPKLVSYITRILLPSPSATNNITNDDNYVGTIPRYMLSKVIRLTAFHYFTGGDSLATCTTRVHHLYQHYRIHTIVDQSSEEKISQDSWDLNMELKCQVIRQSKTLFQEKLSYLPIKLTGMICPMVLERICEIVKKAITLSLSSSSGYESSIDDNNDDPVGTESWSFDEALLLLTPYDQLLFSQGMQRLIKVCHVASECKVSLLIDAEQYARQPAIDYIARLLSKQFNRISADDQLDNEKTTVPCIFNTYQAYLHRTPQAIEHDIQAARNGGYVFAAKIVRGAYMYKERELAVTFGYPDPILASKEATDHAYDKLITRLLGDIESSTSSTAIGSISIVIATHNRESIEHALQLMDKLQITRDDPRVHFAQILGMADRSSIMLGLNGYGVSKLVPFGPFNELLPWLLRRLDENKDMLGAMQKERHVYVDEIQYRIKSWFSISQS